MLNLWFLNWEIFYLFYIFAVDYHSNFPDSGCRALQVIGPAMLSQDQLWRLFDLIPGLDYCTVKTDTRARMVSNLYFSLFNINPPFHVQNMVVVFFLFHIIIISYFHIISFSYHITFILYHSDVLFTVSNCNFPFSGLGLCCSKQVLLLFVLLIYIFFFLFFWNVFSFS